MIGHPACLGLGQSVRPARGLSGDDRSSAKVCVPGFRLVGGCRRGVRFDGDLGCSVGAPRGVGGGICTYYYRNSCFKQYRYRVLYMY